MRHLVRQAGLGDQIEVDSAGTCAYHVGEAPDPRARAAAQSRGIRVAGSARKFARGDWRRFDYVLAMDGENYRDLLSSAPTDAPGRQLFMLRSFDPDAEPDASVPDPYYGGERGFDVVLDQCEKACRGLLAHIRREHGL
jgi:protein-tyrosine phosphatase